MKGYILWLKKRHRDSGTSIYCTNGYVMFGYYDFMTVKSVEGWSGFDPSGYSEDNSYRYGRSGYSGSDTEYHEEFPLKLITPSCDGSSDESQVFSESPLDKADAPFADAPFIVVTMLHFTEGAVASVGDIPLLNSRLKKSIKICSNLLWPADKDYETLKSLNISTYYTTGFCDMVVIAKTSHTDALSDLMTALRSATVYTNTVNKRIHLLSTLYTISGIRSDFNIDNCPDSLRCDLENMRVSIQFLLKTGVSVDDFYDELRKQMIQRDCADGRTTRIDLHMPERGCIGDSVNEHNVSSGNLFSQTYGYSDVVLLPDCNPYLFMFEFTDEKCGLFYYGSKFHRKYLQTTRSTIRRIPLADSKLRDRLKGEMLSSDDADEQLRNREAVNDNLNKEINGVCDTLDGYFRLKYTYIKENYTSTHRNNSDRSYEGLRHTLDLYYNLAQYDHGFDIKKMLSSVLDSFRINIKIATNELEQHCSKPDHDRDEAAKYIHETDESIEYFRHELNELLLDFSRADRRYIEGRTMLHTAIGSATKLLLSYSRLMQVFTNIARDTKFHVESTYAFMVSSGGVNHTLANMLFSHIDPIIRDPGSRDAHFTLEEHRLLKISLPEKTLFKPGAAIYFLVHESMHFIGFRYPKVRAQKLKESINTYIAHNLTYLLDGFDLFVSQNIPGLSPEIREKTRGTIAEYINNTGKKKMRCKIKKYLQETDPVQAIIDRRRKEDVVGIDSLGTLSVHMEKIYRQAYHEALISRYNDTDGTLAAAVTKVFTDCILELLNGVSAIFKCDATRRYAVELIFDAYRNIRGFNPSFILQALDEMAGNVFHEQKAPPNAEIGNVKYLTYPTDSSSPRVELQTVGNIIGNFIITYSEVFVDIMTSTYLGCEVPEYLYITMCENESPVFAMPLDSVEVVFRFGGILSLMDRDLRAYLDLDFENYKCSIEKRMREYEPEVIALFPKNDHADVGDVVEGYLAHIVELLCLFKTEYYDTKIASPLFEYIDKCRDYHNEHIDKELNENQKAELQAIRNTFTAGLHIEHSRENTEGWSCADSKNSAWYRLIRFWLNAANIDTMKGQNSDECF